MNLLLILDTEKIKTRLDYLHSLRDGNHIEESRLHEREYLDLLYIWEGNFELVKDKTIFQRYEEKPA